MSSVLGAVLKRNRLSRPTCSSSWTASACSNVEGIPPFALTIRGQRAGLWQSSIGVDEADTGDMPMRSGHCGQRSSKLGCPLMCGRTRVSDPDGPYERAGHPQGDRSGGAPRLISRTCYAR